MAQLFVDSFSGYATADLPTRWAGGITNAPLIDATVVPPGSQVGTTVLDLTSGNSAVLSNNYGSLSRYILGFNHYRAVGSGGGITCGLLHTAPLFTPHYAVIVQMTNTGTYICDDALNILGTGPIVLTGEWNHFECDFQLGLAGTANIFIYRNGNPTPFVSAVGVSTSYAVAEQFFLGRQTSNTAPPVNGDASYNASFYAFSGTGPVAMFNAPLAPQGFGAPAVAFAVPNGAGIVSAWTPNGAATVWQSIDQIPQDGDTTYASSATVGQEYMTTFGTLPTMSSLLSVQLSTYARTDDAGPRSYQSGFYNGGVFGFSGVNNFLGLTYNYYEDEYMLNPINGLPWSPAALTGLQFGAELTT